MSLLHLADNLAVKHQLRAWRIGVNTDLANAAERSNQAQEHRPSTGEGHRCDAERAADLAGHCRAGDAVVAVGRVVLLVAEHAGEENLTRLIYEALGISGPAGPRTKPTCSDRSAGHPSTRT